jgi:hypothetical protein
MTKRDNELSRHELLDKRVKQMLERFMWHRGQLPQDLLTAVEGVRKAHEMKDAPMPAQTPHTGPVPWWNPVHEPPKDVEDANRAVPVVSEPVPAVAPDAPAKPGDLT